MILNSKLFSKINCIVCKNKKFKFIFSDYDHYIGSTKKKFSLLKCVKCELITIHPKILESEFDTYYPKDYKQYIIDKKIKNYPQVNIKKIRNFIINLFKIDKVKNELDMIKDLNKKYLDFGSGNGRHLSYIKAQYPKWNLYGYDKSKFAKNNLRKNNFNSIDNLEDITDNYFDIINLSSVIEHLEDPSKYMALLKNKLSKNGIIIIKTPNWKSLGRIFFTRNWINYDIPRHMYIFSSKNLTIFLLNNNLKIIKLTHSNNIGVELKSFYRLLRLTKRPKFHNLFTKLFLPFGIFLNLLKLSSTITIICKKNV